MLLAQHTAPEYRALVGKLREQLQQCMRERPKRPEFIRAEPAWVYYEREQMLALVNAERAMRQLAPIELAAIVHAEERSYGPRYSWQFATACADLVLGQPLL